MCGLTGLTVVLSGTFRIGSFPNSGHTSGFESVTVIAVIRFGRARAWSVPEPKGRLVDGTTVILSGMFSTGCTVHCVRLLAAAGVQGMCALTGLKEFL